MFYVLSLSNEPPHDKTNNVVVRPAKTQLSLSIRPVWSESSLFAWRKLRSLATHWAHSEDSDQTGRMPRLIWVFAGCKVILLVLSWGGSNAPDSTYHFYVFVAETYSTIGILSLCNWSLIKIHCYDGSQSSGRGTVASFETIVLAGTLSSYSLFLSIICR